jgi:3-phenylpropionate/trans-cinnamate dioxygenase ferredoxin reductase component
MKSGRFVIVGAALAGGSAAAALREGGFEGEITLIGPEKRLPVRGPAGQPGRGSQTR